MYEKIIIFTLHLICDDMFICIFILKYLYMKLILILNFLIKLLAKFESHIWLNNLVLYGIKTPKPTPKYVLIWRMLLYNNFSKTLGSSSNSKFFICNEHLKSLWCNTSFNYFWVVSNLIGNQKFWVWYQIEDFSNTNLIRSYPNSNSQYFHAISD